MDVRLSYQIDDKVHGLGGTTVSLGVVNLFDRRPPFVNIAQSSNGGGGFDPTLTNPIGRIVSLSLDKTF
jgi:iron complex outermembrane receptor protein